MSGDPALDQALEEELRLLFATVPSPPPVAWARPTIPAVTRGWRARWAGRGAWDFEARLVDGHPPSRWAVAAPPGPSRHGGGWLRRRSARVVLSGLTAVAVAVATFAVLDVSLAQHHAPVAGLGSASATPSPSSTPATASPAQPVSPASCLLPVAETATAGGSTEYGFLATATGQFQADGTAPTPSTGSESGYYSDIYVPGMGGWRSAPYGAVVSPGGTSLAYQALAASPTPSPTATPGPVLPVSPINGGQIHIVDASGQDRAVTPGGEHDMLLGWATQGIVIAHVDVTTNSAGPVYLVDPATGAERALGIDESSGTLDVEAVSGDAIWYGTGGGSAGEPQTLVQYDIATATTRTWFDTEGTSYGGAEVSAVNAQGEPVVLTWDASDFYLLLLTQPNQAATVWTGPVETEGFYNDIGVVTADQGWLWFEIEVMEPAAQASAAKTPGGEVVLLSAAGSGLEAMPDGPGPLAAGSTLTLYWWDQSSGSHAVTTMPVSGGSGAGDITVAGSCLGG